MSVIYLKDLVVTGTHGVHQAEKDHPQRFSISVELSFDASAAATSDDLKDTINYSTVRQIIIDVVQNTSFNLLERLAQTIGDRILVQDERPETVFVSVSKLDVFETGIPGVELEVSRRS